MLVLFKWGAYHKWGKPPQLKISKYPMYLPPTSGITALWFASFVTFATLKHELHIDVMLS